jgi:hypothetical protein
MKFTLKYLKIYSIRGLIVMIVALSFKCGTSDLDSIDPFEFITEEFEDVPEVEVVEDPEPVIADVETGTVGNLEVSGEIVSAVIAVVESSGGLVLTTETEEIVENVETVTDAVLISALESDDEEQLNEALENFNEEQVEALLDEETVLDEAQSSFAGAVEQSTELETIAAVLPQIELSDDFLILDEEFPEDLDLDLELSARETGSTLRLLTLVGPCAESANDAYAAAVAALEVQRDANLASIEGNYQRRITEAETRFSQRTAGLNQQLDVVIASVRENVRAILSAASRSAELGNVRRARQLRSYAFVYSYYTRVLVFAWARNSREVIRRVRIREIANAQQIRDEKSAEVVTNYNRSLVVANTIRQEALNNCHNQGAGN